MLWWVEEPEWKPTLFVVGNTFFFMWVRRLSWRGPFAQWEEWDQ